MVMPIALLEKSVDKRVSLLLKDGRVLEGRLTGYDEYMNMVLDEVSERTADAEERRLGTVVLRGNNVVSIAVLRSLPTRAQARYTLARVFAAGRSPDVAT